MLLTVTEFNFYARNGTSNAQILVPLIYKVSSSNVPTTLVVTGSAVTVAANTTARWITANLPSTNLPAGKYALVLQGGPSSNETSVYYTPVTGAGVFGFDAYPGADATWRELTWENRSWSMYVSGSAASSADTVAPSTPTGMRVLSGPTTSSVGLTWNASTDTGSGVSLYQIYRNGTAWKTATITAFTDENLISGGTYDYEVQAVDKAGNKSGKSTPILRVNIPAIVQPPVSSKDVEPESLKATARSTTQSWLKWNAISGADYRVYRRVSTANTFTRLVESTGTATGYSDGNLTPGLTYVYKVEAVRNGATLGTPHEVSLKMPTKAVSVAHHVPFAVFAPLSLLGTVSRRQKGRL